MLETPSSFAKAACSSQSALQYGVQDLSRYRYHTGATLRPLALEETCPILFRDLGPVALRGFLLGQLTRLAGPFSPITYLRTIDYREPYTDYERIGRLIFLRPLLLSPWHSGVPSVFVAQASCFPDPSSIGYVPGVLDLAEVGKKAAAMRSVYELREDLGGKHYDDLIDDCVDQLHQLEASLEASERALMPLRRAFASPRQHDRVRAREVMNDVGLTESDLCTAWHHLPRPRREFIHQAMTQIAPKSFERQDSCTSHWHS